MRSVTEEVKSNPIYILIMRDRTERYTARPNGDETQSEGMGHVEDVSVEGARLLYKPEGSNECREVMYFHISDEKRYNASTVHENIMHVLNDLNTGASNKNVPEI